MTRLLRKGPPPPVRIAHLGAGNFFRAHQAWYTEHAGDGWGIAAFTGRSRDVVDDPAQGRYLLFVRAADGDRMEIIDSVASVSGDLDTWRKTFGLDGLAVVTTTVTEAGYRVRGGHLDRDDPAVAADIAALQAHGTSAEVTTAPAKLVLGLAVRRAAGLPGVAVVPCDNLPGNGAVAAAVVGELAVTVDPQLASWIDGSCAFVTTMVDRITPRPTSDVPISAVVTEPYTEWVLAGEFPAGRPAWENAGARFVTDVEPWEHRKLWLLNGSHSLMAYAGSIRGHETVAEAIADPVVRGWVEQWWDVAARHLPLPATEIADYRAALLERYANPRIRHLLRQIAADGSQKVPVRVWPVLSEEVRSGHIPDGATRILAAWVLHLRGRGAPVTDVAADELRSLAGGDLHDAVRRVLTRIDMPDERVHAAVARLATELEG
ncbi:mannitol dehydrogenase family protein [Pseudonocardia sp. CA-107938]|uniref:mannitol dehydrogenase family protein n=1 Tax=Pseudonocardia sp. CA-107938 TaxID=3240021 RepID=UPI003D9406CA